jgi:hypothetical protein
MIEAVAALGRRAPPVEPIAAAVEAVANHPARLRTLAAALTGRSTVWVPKIGSVQCALGRSGRSCDLVAWSS